MKRHLGDDGRTDVPRFGRVSKASAVCSALGDLDELNAALGMTVAACPSGGDEGRSHLEAAQRLLIEIGACCAGCAPAGSEAQITAATLSLDAAVAVMETRLPPLRALVVPGGHPGACAAHFARAVCRRAERGVVGLIEAGASDVAMRAAAVYLNRLSSLLFSVARIINAREPHAHSRPIGVEPIPTYDDDASPVARHMTHPA